ncbi:Protein translocase subunit YajC [hydrothermal vent metagenome]|uniref:Protein translocase subunit YajC n=1 Tax=hydrothermal vent metagenome TaxID=652676 RepID=A0A3B0ZMF4_9ZZZZ
MNFFISEAIAEAGATAADAPDPISFWIFMGGMIALFYFMLIRPQQKRAKDARKLVESIAKGDEVVTSGGMLGKIVDVSDLYASIELADNIVIRMQKASITAVMPKGTIKAALKD